MRSYQCAQLPRSLSAAAPPATRRINARGGDAREFWTAAQTDTDTRMCRRTRAHCALTQFSHGPSGPRLTNTPSKEIRVVCCDNRRPRALRFKADLQLTVDSNSAGTFQKFSPAVRPLRHNSCSEKLKIPQGVMNSRGIHELWQVADGHSCFLRSCGPGPARGRRLAAPLKPGGAMEKHADR